jgi:TLD
MLELETLLVEMGNVLGTSSTPPNESRQIQQRRNDLDVLGQRVSFGDDELVHLYDSYDLFLQQRERDLQNGGTLRNSSFLYDLYEAILLKDRKATDSPEPNIMLADHLTTTATSPSFESSSESISHMENEISKSMNEKVKIERLQSIKYVIQHILPPNFDTALFKGCFTSMDDPIHMLYNFSGSVTVDTMEGNRNSSPTRVEDKDAISFQTATADVVAETIPEGMTILNHEGQLLSNAFTLVDEFTRKTRLCTFFEALSCSIGRRSSKEYIASLFRTIHLLQNHSESRAGVVASTNQNPRVSSQIFVETGYRFALALAYLQQCRERRCESSMNLEQFLPLCDNDTCKASLHAMAKSIVEKRHRRLNQQRADWSDAVNASSNDSESSEGVENDWIELDDVIEWIDVVAPMFPFIIPTFFQYILFPNNDALPKSRTFFNVPIMNWKTEQPTNSSILSSKASFLSVRNFALACFTPALNGSYFPLYSSNADGLSFNRLQNSVLGYSGPTLFVIQCESGGIFGAYTATAWKESKDFYGNTDCFLYQLWPRTVLYRPTSSERNFLYCNSAARSHGYDQQAHGIGFGGTVQSPRLFLAENFDDCSASSQDLTFENGPLLPDVGTSGNLFGSISVVQRHRSLFAIECLEVWGVGGSKDVVQAALLSRESNRAQAADLINKARKVDKAQFLDDFRSGTISSKAFAHRQQVDGRADVDLDERVKDKEKAYNYA